MQSIPSLPDMLQKLGLILDNLKPTATGWNLEPLYRGRATLSHARLHLGTDAPGFHLWKLLPLHVQPDQDDFFVEAVPGQAHASGHTLAPRWYRFNPAKSLELCGLRWLCVTPPSPYDITGIQSLCFQVTGEGPVGQPTMLDTNPVVSLHFHRQSVEELLGPTRPLAA